MRKITSLFVALGLVASLAVAGDGEGCPGQAKKSCEQPTALGSARQALADAIKSSESMPAEKRAELETLRDTMMQTPFGKAMGPSYEACGRLMLAASAQPGSSPEAAALLKDMAATYCSMAKVFGGCAECKCCEGSGGACKDCGSKDADALTKKATESLDSAKKLLATAMDEMQKMSPEDMQKMQAAGEKLMKECPVATAIKGVHTALNDSYASLAKMGIPSAEGKGAADELVKGAMGMHAMLSCEECEKPAETTAPGKSS